MQANLAKEAALVRAREAIRQTRVERFRRLAERNPPDQKEATIGLLEKNEMCFFACCCFLCKKKTKNSGRESAELQLIPRRLA